MNITKQHDSPMIGIGEGLHTVDLKKKKIKCNKSQRLTYILDGNANCFSN